MQAFSSREIAQPEPRDRTPPRAIGHLNVGDGIFTDSFSMTTDALDPVLQILLAGRFKYAVLYGEPMRYPKSLIRSYEL